MRYSTPEKLKAACKSILGLHWHERLNFGEVDMDYSPNYKSMQAMRHLSKEQRVSVSMVWQILLSLCMALEKRMMNKEVHAKKLAMFIQYKNGESWSEKINLNQPLQGGTDLMSVLEILMGKYEKKNAVLPLINAGITSMGVGTSDFISDMMVQYDIFQPDLQKKDSLRKVAYNIKSKYGQGMILKASELQDESTFQDVIGFGSIKDMEEDFPENDFVDFM